jgi:hypothetical protein
LNYAQIIFQSIKNEPPIGAFRVYNLLWFYYLLRYSLFCSLQYSGNTVVFPEYYLLFSKAAFFFNETPQNSLQNLSHFNKLAKIMWKLDKPLKKHSTFLPIFKKAFQLFY